MNEATSVAAAGAVSRTKPASAAGQFAWALFDGARSPYNVLINIFVFSAYFSTVVIPDPVRGQVMWSYVTSGAGLLVAVTAPVLGAIADAGGRRKPWLIGTLLIGIPSMIGMWFAMPGMTDGLGWIVAALIGGILFFEYSAIFCNAMLPNVAPPGRIGLLSGAALALGNMLGIALFLFYLFAWSWNPQPLFGLDPQAHEPERAVGILAAFCIAVFGCRFSSSLPTRPARPGAWAR
jgi:UMF1 family MFS transporter